jgi:hypothetical protein
VSVRYGAPAFPKFPAPLPRHTQDSSDDKLSYYQPSYDVPSFREPHHTILRAPTWVTIRAEQPTFVFHSVLDQQDHITLSVSRGNAGCLGKKAKKRFLPFSHSDCNGSGLPERERWRASARPTTLALCNPRYRSGEPADLFFPMTILKNHDLEHFCGCASPVYPSPVFD